MTTRARMFAPGVQAQAIKKASNTQAVFGTLGSFEAKPGVPGIATSKAHPKVPSSPAQSTAPAAGGQGEEVVESTGGSEKTVEELTARLESARAAMKPRKVSDLSQPPCTKHGRAAGSVLIDH